MSKIHTKEELRQKAMRLAEAHGVQSIYATADGEVFLQKHLAASHAAEGRKVDERLPVYTYGEADTVTGKVTELLGKLAGKPAADALELHDSPEQVAAAAAAAAKAAEAATVPGAGKGKKAAKADDTAPAQDAKAAAEGAAAEGAA